MLPKENRLKKRKDFENATKTGKILQSSLFGVAFVVKEVGPTRFGIVVSTKISKKASERNKVKRLLRDTIRERLSRASPGFDVVFLVKKKILVAKRETIEKETEGLLQKAGILK